MGLLGRLEPTDFRHLDRFPIRRTFVDYIPEKPTPVVLGINWYSDFDSPIWDPKYRIWRIGNNPRQLGHLRGGHAIEVPNKGHRDSSAWYKFYNQGQEGACVGFAISRSATHLNRTRYDARWLYKEAQIIDEWPGEDYDGTSVRAGLEVLRTVGHRRIDRHGFQPTHVHDVDPLDGISTYRWTTDIEEVKLCSKHPLISRYNAIPLCNSWGEEYPHIVWMFDETAQLMLDQYGEAGIITDR